MTSAAPYRPRHAATPGPRPVDTPTMVLPVVVPARQPTPASAPPPQREVLRATDPLTYAPPAGLPVGHEPIRPRSAAPVVLAAVATFVVVSSGVVAIGNLARDAATVAGHGATSGQITDQRDGGVAGRP